MTKPHIFNKATIQKLKTNYSPIEEIKIKDNFTTTNTFNTFNTFWKGAERNGSHKDTLKVYLLVLPYLLSVIFLTSHKPMFYFDLWLL
jgi:hypothetical protein